MDSPKTDITTGDNSNTRQDKTQLVQALNLLFDDGATYGVMATVFDKTRRVYQAGSPDFASFNWAVLNPLKSETKKRTAEDIDRIQAVTIEHDNTTLDAQRELLKAVPYTVLVASGGKSIHCHVRFTSPITCEQYATLKEKILLAFPDCDENVLRKTQPSRMPGAYRADKQKFQTVEAVGERREYIAFCAWLDAHADPAAVAKLEADKREESQRQQERERRQASGSVYHHAGGYGPGYYRAVIETLQRSLGVCDDRGTWLRLLLALKAGGIDYATADTIFAGSLGYKEAENHKAWDKETPKKIDFSTAYHIAEQANSALLGQLLAKYPDGEPHNEPLGRAVQSKEPPLAASSGNGNDSENDTGIEETSYKTWLVGTAKKGDKKGELVYILLANFVCRLTAVIRNGAVYTWRLSIGTAGQKTQILAISPKEKAAFSDFRLAIAGLPGALFYHANTVAQHNAFMLHVFTTDTDKVQNLVQQDGFGDNGEHFVFANGAISSEGKQKTLAECELLAPDMAGKTPKIIKTEFDFKRLPAMFTDLYGLDSWRLLGFVAAAIVSEPLFNEFGAFPLLFLYGVSGTGKSNLAKILAALTGYNGTIQDSSTGKFIQRLFASHASMIVPINEYTSKKNILLCSIFDREGYGRAKKSTDNATEYSDIKACACIISTLNVVGAKSEDVLTRVIRYPTAERALTASQRKIEGELVRLAQRGELGAFVQLAYPAKKQVVGRARALANDAQYYELNARATMVQAVCRAAYETVFGDPVDEERFLVAIKSCTAMVSEQDKAQLFLDLTLSYVKTNRIEVQEMAWIKDDNLLFSLPQIYPSIARFARQAGLDLPDKATLALGLARLKVECEVRKNQNDKAMRLYLYPLPVETLPDAAQTPESL